jgi:hypothetical protein
MAPRRPPARLAGSDDAVSCTPPPPGRPDRSSAGAVATSAGPAGRRLVPGRPVLPGQWLHPAGFPTARPHASPRVYGPWPARHHGRLQAGTACLCQLICSAPPVLPRPTATEEHHLSAITSRLLAHADRSISRRHARRSVVLCSQGRPRLSVSNAGHWRAVVIWGAARRLTWPRHGDQ